MIIKKIGTVAYKSALPLELLLHPTFHVSQLKPCYALPDQVSHPPVVNLSSPYFPSPNRILERRMVQKGNKAIVQVLVECAELPETESVHLGRS